MVLEGGASLIRGQILFAELFNFLWRLDNESCFSSVYPFLVQAANEGLRAFVITEGQIYYLLNCYCFFGGWV